MWAAHLPLALETERIQVSSHLLLGPRGSYWEENGPNVVIGRTLRVSVAWSWGPQSGQPNLLGVQVSGLELRQSLLLRVPLPAGDAQNLSQWEAAPESPATAVLGTLEKPEMGERESY